MGPPDREPREGPRRRDVGGRVPPHGPPPALDLLASIDGAGHIAASGEGTKPLAGRGMHGNRRVTPAGDFSRGGERAAVILAGGQLGPDPRRSRDPGRTIRGLVVPEGTISPAPERPVSLDGAGVGGPLGDPREGPGPDPGRARREGARRARWRLINAATKPPAHQVAVLADGAGLVLSRDRDVVPGRWWRAGFTPPLEAPRGPQTDRAALVEDDLAKGTRRRLASPDKPRFPPADNIPRAADRAGGAALRRYREEGPPPQLGSVAAVLATARGQERENRRPEP
jgi:hypothetical protein